MLNDDLRAAVERALSAPTARWQPCGATGWGEAWSCVTAKGRYFVKLASGRHAAMLACEADGLVALARTATVRVPQVAAAGACDGMAFLALEWLDLGAGTSGGALGRALAALHRCEAPRGPAGDRFGWHRDNWIGGTPQANGWCDDWCTFFRDRRLGPQLALAAANGFRVLRQDGERLLAMLPRLLDHRPAPSLVHGDLWSGNAATLRDGTPVVFDPAVYVGDREVDVAMTELFGGLGAEFRSAYEDAWPLDAGHAMRRDVYDLYHLLNHLNLFGSAYLERCRATLACIAASI
jgi:fructosamine-3-kinase